MFWSCQVFSVVAGEVNYCINYIFYFIVFSFLSFYLTFVSFVLSCFVSFSFLFFSSILFSSYTCIRVWSRTLSGRLCRISSSFSENMAEKDCRTCAASRRSSSTLTNVCVSGKYGKTRNSCLLSVEKWNGVATWYYGH
jgi:hypothetical protein